MDNRLTEAYISILKEELLMATGCTEEIRLDDSLYTALYNKSLDRQLAGMADLFGTVAETE